jgi:biopolymer transport protein ExbD
MPFGGFEQGRARSQPMAEINVTPLVDVMLVLLVIFIITAPLLSYALKVDLPEVSAAPARPETEPARMSIDRDGTVYLGTLALDDAALKAALTEIAARRPVPELQLRVDKAARFDRVALTMSLAQEAGLAKIGFVTEPAVVRPTP